MRVCNARQANSYHLLGYSVYTITKRDLECASVISFLSFSVDIPSDVDRCISRDIRPILWDSTWASL
jgi:hypothetical protein